MTYLEQSRRHGQDRLSAFSDGSSAFAVVADGAGGLSGGGEAADMIVAKANNHLIPTQMATDVLADLDQAVFEEPLAGESTCVLIRLIGDSVTGASVGDSAAWYFDEERAIELTERQIRRPFLGSGRIQPVSFSLPFGSGQILVATDGLWNYTSMGAIREYLRQRQPGEPIDGLADLCRLRSGALQDDIAIVLIERSLLQRTVTA